MPGTKGKITVSASKKRKSVYLSDRFGMWEEKGRLHITVNAKNPHTNVSVKDGLLFDVLMMLYQHGLKTGATDHASKEE